MKEHRSGEWTPELTDLERKTLFAICRDTLTWCVGGSNTPFLFTAYDLTPKLKAEFATFVTLNMDGDLRGCIGSLTPEEPLYLSVHHNAVNAAIRDPRFKPVSRHELPLLEIHVSILSPIKDIPSPGHFRLGEHGLILQKGSARAVFLPEVPVEQDWDVETTLNHLSMKAGLSASAWKANASFQVFSSVVLTEE